MPRTASFFLIVSTLLASLANLAAARDTVVLNDAAVFFPQTALSVQPSQTAWRKVDDPKSPSGWRLEADHSVVAPDIEFPLNVEGIYDVYVGVYMPNSLTSGVHVRADNEPYFHFVKGWCDGKYPAYHETLYQTMDCTGRKLVFRQANAVCAYITHVKLVPRKSIPELPPATKETLGLSCTFHDYYFYGQRQGDVTSEAIVKSHELYGLTELVFCCGRSVLTYETKIGTPHKPETKRPRTGLLAKCGREQRPLGKAIAAAKARGIKLSGRLSMNCHYHGSYENALTSRFVLDNPHMHAKRKNGSVDNHRMCYGYPEVRAERVAILREMVELGCDHLFLDCRRYMPMTQWGDPLVESFQKKYGVDPKTLEEDNELWQNWLRHRAGFFTTVLRDLKKTLKDMGREDVTVTIRVYAVPIAKTLEQGAEIDVFIKEALIDRIVLGEKDSRDVAEEYLDLVQGTGVKVLGCMNVHGAAMAGPEHHTSGVWPGAMYHTPDIAKIAEATDALYEMGVDGMAFYETDEGCRYPRLRELFIACRNPQALKEYRRKLDREAAERLAAEFGNVTFRHAVTPEITASVGPIDAKPQYAVEKAIDGDPNTHYISARGCCRPGGPGCTVTLAFDEPTTIDRLAILSRDYHGSHLAPRKLVVKYDSRRDVETGRRLTVFKRRLSDQANVSASRDQTAANPYGGRARRVEKRRYRGVDVGMTYSRFPPTKTTSDTSIVHFE